jgi:ribosomal protein S18 acetylase RimI-like enzyme
MPIRYKKCTLLDLHDLIRISKKTFVDAYEKDNDPEDFNSYIDFAFDEKNISQQLKNPECTFYFCYWNNHLAGYFKLNVNQAQTDLKERNSIELERIYVFQEFQGKQIGSFMLDFIKRIASIKKKDFVWLGVWQKNEDAVRFYESHGFIKFGTHPYYIGKDKQTDWLMRHELINFHEN